MFGTEEGTWKPRRSLAASFAEQEIVHRFLFDVYAATFPGRRSSWMVSRIFLWAEECGSKNSS
jgi:hypothetical protein